MDRYNQPYAYPFYAQSVRKGNVGKFNTPNIPLLGQQPLSILVRSIYDSIVDEASATEFYSRLMIEVTDELHREFIEHAYQDELKHLDAFTKLYAHLTGQQPIYTVKPVKYNALLQGVKMALKDELEAVEFYRDIQLSTTDQLVKDTFFHAMVDELEHATQFGIIYNAISKD